jgi:hypothetical protein
MTTGRYTVSARHSPGFALVAVMVIGAMAAVAAATIAAVAVASAGVASADRRSELAHAAADTGLVDALDRLAWGLAGDCGPQVRESYRADLDGEESYTVGLTKRLPGVGWPCTYDVEVIGEHGAASTAVHALVRLAPTGLPCGVSVVGQLACTAEMTVRGSGVYVGSDVHGREQMSFASAEDSTAVAGDPPADGAHGELWTISAVHAGGQIYSEGSEEHAGAGAPAADTDACTGGAPPESLTALPSTATLANLSSRSPVLQTPYPGGSLDLTTLAGPKAVAGASSSRTPLRSRCGSPAGALLRRSRRRSPWS